MKRGTLARMNYLWLKGSVLRTLFPTIWWAGYKAAHVGLDDVPPKGMKWSDSEVEAFKSGHEYQKEIYGEQG